jgi:hypothetical protein
VFDPASWIFFSLVGSSPSLGSPRKKNMLTLPPNKLAFRLFCTKKLQILLHYAFFTAVTEKILFPSTVVEEVRATSCYYFFIL